MNKKYKSIILSISLYLALSASTSAAPGDLDRTFSGDGKLTDWSGWATKIVIQPDGKIVVAGLNPPFSWSGPTPNHNFLVARYNSDGSPDVTFGGGTGRLVIDSGNPDYVRGIAIQGDGKILLTGRFMNVGAVLIRLNPNGSYDTAFGSNGIATTSCDPSGIAVQSDGRIVISHFYVGACRHNPDGSRDTSLGVGGFVSTVIGENPFDYQYSFSMAIQPDGKIVLAGGIDTENGTPTYTVLIRYNPDGSLDTSFGGTGIVRTRPTDDFGLARRVLLQPDGKIVAVGDLHIVRYKADGSLDSGFGSGGIAAGPPWFLSNYINAALQTDRKIAVSYNVLNGTNVDFAIARYNTNGSLDTTFGGGDGITTVDFNNSNDIASAVALDSQGRAVVVGTSDEAFAIARLLLEPRHTPFDFDGDGRSDISVFRPSDRTWYLNQSANGFSATQFGLSTDKITPADYDGDGRTDISVYRDGTWYWLNSSDNSFSAYQFGIASDIPVPADYDGDGGVSELAVYRNGTWWILNLANNQVTASQFGLATDQPVVGDYDGDGRVDQAVYRNGEWHLNRSTQGYTVINFGLASDRPVVGDYDGDGKSDIAVYRDGTWYVQQSTAGFRAFQWGIGTDIPAPADYDGDGRTDPAVFRDGTWYLLQSTGGISIQNFGLANDKPVPEAYLP